MVGTLKKRRNGRNREAQLAILAKIESGEYPVGSKLPPGRTLAEELEVSYVTLNSAMRRLEELGHVHRIHGSGVFVRSPKERTPSNRARNRQVGCLLPMLGDLYQSFTHSFMLELEPNDHYLTPLPTTSVLDTLTVAERERRIAKFAAEKFAALVVAGSRHVPYGLLEKRAHEFRQMIFVMFNESAANLPESDSIICDYERVGYLAAEKLLKSGRRKLAMITYEPFSEMETRRNKNRRFGLDTEMTHGIEQAFVDAGVPFVDNFDILHDFAINPTRRSTAERIGEMIRRNATDGFICVGDHRAKFVYEAAGEMNMSVGGEIGVVGLFNTSWGKILNPNLTSISINEEKTAKLAAELILNNAKGEKIIVEPTLVEREST
jgi:DNA-binding LacI/PurR family transcriptional regulator